MNTVEQGKTALHVAVEESRIDILKVILRYKPDLSRMVHMHAHHLVYRARPSLPRVILLSHALNYKRVWREGLAEVISLFS